MEALKRIKDVLTRPTHFFTHLRERGIITAFMYLSFLAFFTSFLKEIASFWSTSLTQKLAATLFDRTLEEYQLILGPFLSNVLLSYLIILLTSFLWAGILHGWILLFAGKGSFTQTYQLSVYARIPEFLFGWIPFIGTLSSVYGLVLLIKGTQKLHHIPKNRSIWMYVIPFILLFSLFLGSLVFLFAATTRIIA